MPDVLACVDGSAYDGSVCDHAAWLASRMDAHVDILHVTGEPHPAARGGPAGSGANPDPRAVERRARERLRDSGVAPRRSHVRRGDFSAVAAELGAGMYVMGKRGADSSHDRRHLGSNVERLIRLTEAPICLASLVFLPVNRALVLLDADMQHRASVEFVAGHPGLRSLNLDLVIVDAPGRDPGPKLHWARERLDSRAAEIFTVTAEGLTEGLVQHMESGRADLFLISRSVLLPAPEARLQRIEEGGLWAWRTPVVVC